MEEFAKWAEGLKIEEFPQEVIKKAKLQVLSVISAGVSGFFEARRFLERFPVKSGECSSLFFERRTDLISSIFINSFFSMVHDYDDYLFLGHTGHSSVWTSLAVSQEYGLSGIDFLKGIIIGNELEGRLGAAVVLGPLNGQTFAHIHQAGSSSIFCTLRGGKAPEIENSVYLSLYLPPFCILSGFMGGEGKFLTAGIPSVSGIFCGISAVSGMKGNRETLNDFLKRFSFRPIPGVLSGWGKVWTTNTLSYKIYPGCAYIDSAIDCMMRIKKRFEEERGRRILPGDIEEVKVYATILSVAMEKASESGRGESLTPVNINFSIPLSISVLISSGELSPGSLSEKNLNEKKGEILKVAGKIELIHDWKLTLNMFKRMNEKVDFISLSGITLKDMPFLIKSFRREHGKLMGIKNIGLRIPFKELLKISRKRIKDLSETDLNSFPMPFSARVVAKIGGKLYEEFQEDPLGSAGRPFSETEELVIQKFKKETEVLGREKTERILNSVLEVEKLKDMRDFPL